MLRYTHIKDLKKAPQPREKSQKRLFKSIRLIRHRKELKYSAIEVLSPVRKEKSGVRHFDAKVSDGTKKMRLVSFDEQAQRQLVTLHQTKLPSNFQTAKAESIQVRQMGNSHQQRYNNRFVT